MSGLWRLDCWRQSLIEVEDGQEGPLKQLNRRGFSQFSGDLTTHMLLKSRCKYMEEWAT